MCEVHEMRLAFPSQKVARRLGLNKNRHVRVWCTCQEDAVVGAGTYAGQDAAVKYPRTAYQAVHDPRRLGGWDALGVVDVRDPHAALDLFQAHVREVEK